MSGEKTGLLMKRLLCACKPTWHQGRHYCHVELGPPGLRLLVKVTQLREAEGSLCKAGNGETERNQETQG